MTETIENTLPAVQGNDMGALIQMALTSTEVTPEKLHSLLDFQLRIEGKQAEIDFNEAMSRLQERMPVIKKNGTVVYEKDGKKETAFRFASFDNIMKAIKPHLQAEGFSISFDSAERAGGGAVIMATLSHKGGHSKTASFAAALDSSGGKNNIQAMGSTFSYGKRYCVTALLNIVTEGEDDDGKKAGLDPINDDQAKKLKDLLKETGSDTKKFLELFGVASIDELPAKELRKANALLLAKRDGGGNA